MTYYVYKRHGALDYIVRRDLGDSFIDIGEETPGALWVRLDEAYDSLQQADAGLAQFAAEGAAIEGSRTP